MTPQENWAHIKSRQREGHRQRCSTSLFHPNLNKVDAHHYHNPYTEIFQQSAGIMCGANETLVRLKAQEKLSGIKKGNPDLNNLHSINHILAN